MRTKWILIGLLIVSLLISGVSAQIIERPPIPGNNHRGDEVRVMTLPGGWVNRIDIPFPGVSEISFRIIGIPELKRQELSIWAR